MRYAVLSDIHANLAAFQEVAAQLARQRVEALWHLGDSVGYGPDPRACLELLRSWPHLNIAGNHDWGATGKISTAAFNPDAAAAGRWTGSVLPEDLALYLRDLPEIRIIGDLTLVHGSPRSPVEEYVTDAGVAAANLPFFRTPICLVGHTHIPFVFNRRQNGQLLFRGLEDGETLTLGEGRYIINPGSVGQPRDGDPRGSYAIYDTEAQTLTLHRVAYNIARTQHRMRQEGLPDWLAERLSYGL
jgi:diadenosine tetraphosphatase ApaH/serine/threonine PP2A family protein phosphatase